MMNLFLFIFSILIYASFGITNLFYILFSSLTTFFAAKYLEKKKKKALFWITIFVNLSILIFFKLYLYNSFFHLVKNSIIVPLGISYYTFQILSYFIDVYKGKYDAEHNLYHYLLYVLYIPYLFIGPISRYDQIKTTLFAKRKITESNVFHGLLRIVWGLFKKLVIAGRAGILIATITNNHNTGAFVLFALFLYSIQLYTDFSGGIDIVLGFSKILGIELSENFKVPYLAENLKDFWHRWHMTLSNWLKDYVYIPLGGNRCSKIRNKFNIIITFVISGLWHGINYFLWGLFHGILVAFTPKTKSKFKWINRAINFLIVSLLWIFFIYPTSTEALKMLGTIFTTFNYSDFFSNILNLGLDLPNILVFLLSIFLLIIYDMNMQKINHWLKRKKIPTKTFILCSFVFLILVFGIYGLGFDVNEFIYSKF